MQTTTEMSKLTFRADEDLVRQVEALDASKSEVMREALRAYLETVDVPEDRDADRADTLDALVERRVDALVEERLGTRDRDVNINITLDREPAGADVTDAGTGAVTHDRGRAGAEAAETSPCTQCGEPVAPDHVYCPNCGEKRSRRVFCDCGDEIRTDWSFCPSCGRRTPAADVLE